MEKFDAKHLPPEIGSSGYVVRVYNEKGQVITSTGYANELGDDFLRTILQEKSHDEETTGVRVLEEMAQDQKTLESLGSTTRLIVDGTNFLTPEGRLAFLIPTEKKVPELVKRINEGNALLGFVNPSHYTKLVEMAKEVALDLDPSIPVIVYAGRDNLERMMTMYSRLIRRPENEMAYYDYRGRPIYFVHTLKDLESLILSVHLKDVFVERISGLKKAEWADDEIKQFIKDWVSSPGLLGDDFLWLAQELNRSENSLGIDHESALQIFLAMLQAGFWPQDLNIQREVLDIVLSWNEEDPNRVLALRTFVHFGDEMVMKELVRIIPEETLYDWERERAKIKKEEPDFFYQSESILWGLKK